MRITSHEHASIMARTLGTAVGARLHGVGPRVTRSRRGGGSVLGGATACAKRPPMSPRASAKGFDFRRAPRRVPVAGDAPRASGGGLVAGCHRACQASATSPRVPPEGFGFCRARRVCQAPATSAPYGTAEAGQGSRESRRGLRHGDGAPRTRSTWGLAVCRRVKRPL